MTQAEKWRNLAQILAFTVPMGILVGVGLGWLIGGGSAESLTAGAAIGFLITTGIVAFDASWALGLIPRSWREAPFLVVLVTRSLVWLAIIVVGISLPLLTVAGISLAELVDQTFVISVFASLFAALLFNFVAQVNRLLGHRMLLRLIIGRYHRPREEVRVFLLIDLRGSSQIAQQLGNLRYHAFLRRFVSDVTASAIRFRGEVHRYVGDEVILTWLAQDGLRNAGCVRTVFAISDILEAARNEYETDFGVVPSFWAGLHVGAVVAGEIGTIKHEITYLGDTLNTVARIEQACKQLEQPFLASVDVVSALDLPNDVISESLGSVELRGIDAPIELFSIQRSADRADEGKFVSPPG